LTPLSIVPSSSSQHVAPPTAVRLPYSRYAHPRDLHSFPTRRSSDLRCGAEAVDRGAGRADRGGNFLRTSGAPGDLIKSEENTKGDRKSTRLNSSHVKISYAVFCLKKKTRTNTASIATDARTTERPSV